MHSTQTRSGRGSKAVVAPVLALALTCTGFVLTSEKAIAEPEVPRMAATKLSDEELKSIGLGTAPGKFVKSGIERKYGAKRYVVEIIRASDGAEVEVIIDMATHKVIAIDVATDK